MIQVINCVLCSSVNVVNYAEKKSLIEPDEIFTLAFEIRVRRRIVIVELPPLPASDDGLECHKLMAFSSYVKPKVALALV